MVIDREKTVYIPHLGYTVYLKDATKAKGKAWEELQHYEALTVHGNNCSTIYCWLPITDDTLPYLLHEISHVVEFICQDYGISIVQEKEHIAYLMQYIFSEMSKS